MKIARNIALTALLATLGTAQAASPDENVNTPAYLFPYAPPAIYNPIQPVPPVMDEAQIKAQREAFEAQRKAQIEAITAQQKVFAEQMQRRYEQYQTVMQTQAQAQAKAMEAQQKAMTEHVNQMNERYQTALETQRKAMENPQEFFPAPYGPEVPFMSHPIDAQLELIETERRNQIEAMETQRKAMDEHMQRVFEQHEAAMEARLKAIDAQQRRIFPDRFVRADTVK